MPLDRLWRSSIEEDTELDEEALKEVEERILALQADRSVYDTPAWQLIESKLKEEQANAFQVMMTSDDERLLMAAREHARLCAKLLREPERLDQEFAELQTQRRVLAGETEAEE